MDRDDDAESEGLPPSYEQLGDELPACAVCLQGLGTQGGPASLPCGHNGCLLCLQQVQASQQHPLCPLCRTPFDPELPLCQNTELRDALDRIFQTSQMMRYAELHEQRAAFHEQERLAAEAASRLSKGFSGFDGARSPNGSEGSDEGDHNWVAVSHMPGRADYQWPGNSLSCMSRDQAVNGRNCADLTQGENEWNAADGGEGAGIVRYGGDLNLGDSGRASGGDQGWNGIRRNSDVNLWNVMTGMFAIATGRGRSSSSQLQGQGRPSQAENRARPEPQSEFQNLDPQWEALDEELAGTGNLSPDRSSPDGQTNSMFQGFNGISHGWSVTSNHFPRPSAPPLAISGAGEDVRVLRAVLEAEPPQWVPDSGSTCCMQCGSPFRPITCFRHHCRFCGGLFCNRCTRSRCLLPVQFRQHDPQRVCDTCHERLEPLQRVLADRVSNAAQVALHDVTDWSSIRGWVNNPLASSLQEEIYKATATLRSYSLVGRIKPERSIPETVLRGAAGLAIITVARAGCMVTYRLGTGLVVARRADGSWSAPSAIATCGMGWGLQVGGELTDFIIVLRTYDAVKTFCGRGHLALGAGLSAAAGPLGRHAEADLRLGDKGAASCYSYSCSKGAFVGISVEGNIVGTRSEANMRFYGDPSISAGSILLGATPCPRAAAPLYAALNDLFGKLEGPVNCDSMYF